MAVEAVTKAERKELRRLAWTAYDRELASELGLLEAKFVAWRQGGVDPHELSDAIHEFHDGPSRDLFVFYTRMDPTVAVARAVARGILREGEVPAATLRKLAPQVQFYRDDLTA